jgi:membrane protein
MRAKLLDAFDFARFVLRRWTEDRCPQIAGSLTYTTLLALVPMFAVAVAVLSSAPFFEDVMAKIKIFLLLNLMPEIAGKIITVYMEEFSANAARLTTVGLAAVFVISVALMLIVDRSLNAIWRVRHSRPYWLSVLGYVTLLLAGPLLIGVSVSITTYLMSLSLGITGFAPEVHSRFLRVVPVAVTTVAFFLIYRIIPHRHVPWRHALVGAALAAVLFEAGKDIFTLYVSLAPTYNLVYGAFAAVPIFLIWIYLSWMVILLGAEITASAAYWRGGLWKQPATPGTHFRDAVKVTRALLAAGEAPMSFDALRHATGVPVHELEDTLARMTGAGIARRGGRSGYTLARDPQDVSIADLYSATVAPVGAMRPDEWADVSADFARAANQMREGLRHPIASLAGAAPSPAPPAVRKAKRGRARSGRSSR